MLALAVIICAFLLSRDAAKVGIAWDISYDFIFLVVLWGIVGARLFYILIMRDYFLSNPLEIVMINRGGLAWQGGLVGGVLAGVWFIKDRNLPLRLLLDISAPYIALGQSIGRVGCFLNGCCYGQPWDKGIFFPVHQAWLHPTQLYETAALLLIFFILKFMQGKFLRPGLLFCFYLWFSAIERFIVEFVRADHDLMWPGLSLTQYVSLAVFAAGIAVYIRVKK